MTAREWGSLVVIGIYVLVFIWGQWGDPES